MRVVCVELAVDIPLSGAVLRILKLMALADGVVAPEEEAMLEKICNQYLGKMDVSAWDQVFQDPSDLKQVALKWQSAIGRSQDNALMWFSPPVVRPTAFL